MPSFNQHDLNGFVGKHLVYTYDNGWNYEIYIKNAKTIDYRIHSGIVGNRWVKDQLVYLVRIASEVYKVSWTEPTGTDVSLSINLSERIFHGTIFFPRWVINNPEKTVCFQNDHIAEMEAYREAGPAYPTEVIDEFATITFIRDCGENDDSVINCPANELPADFPNNL
ncbi:phenolic acid decarboxylase [Pectobacteriaceae bacterium CE70]|uniref:Phenolic acid decarboxylase n=1 Tax=Serratia sp. (strain ATCC 39006) TaxID=104623 RepID=A0A2I5T808_SERS3|nr:phenolic acid decarboxylase [Serratia sp. ATCC 39006]WJV60619.1 phenolic acid decarboxylase [Pectobacteriaceae bacterium C52]WJV64964.1 phenolic acid decarboxylase [Pectobacteriaceae bacterium CE70]WJY08984.1 phenolic acid decarboxylase [Pectobacteriaceae bacterium C80]AUH00708.1 phenolic acid decarboxylase [Serratia sp. ATCC 39006]AUH05029.1 phenolic acid decarboxylase [Serratia sp. ATCC 39006]